MTCLDGLSLLDNKEAQSQAIRHLAKAYPFAELIYSLDDQGVQTQETAYSPTVSYRRQRSLGKGSDRSHRPYVAAAKEKTNSVVVTDPYLSSATNKLALSSVQHFVDDQGCDLGYLVINFNLMRLISYLNGDERRSRLHPAFQCVYGLIGGALVMVSLWLFGAAVVSMLEVFSMEHHVSTTSFGVVILITLGLAVFDLGKTILEEEVLVSKDIDHYHSTRRTLMRFMSAIIIAVSIEALLLMFKSVLNHESEQLLSAVWMLLSGVALLTALGLYLKFSREEVREGMS